MSEKIQLSGVPETMLQTIYARAKETKNRGAIRDQKAVEIIEKLDYDFSLADKDGAMHNGVKKKSIEGSKAKFTWGVKDGKELERLLPEFRSVEDHSLVEEMEVFMPIYKLIGKIPAARNISNKILVLERK